jgi:hypothetical protein
MRFITPILGIPDALGDSLQTWLGGLGPGIVRNFDFYGYVVNPFPFSKLMIETGLIGAIPFTIFVAYCFFNRPFSRPISAALYLMYALLSGGLLQPHTVFLFLFLSIIFVRPRGEPEGDTLALRERWNDGGGVSAAPGLRSLGQPT